MTLDEDKGEDRFEDCQIDLNTNPVLQNYRICSSRSGIHFNSGNTTEENLTGSRRPRLRPITSWINMTLERAPGTWNLVSAA